MCGLSLSEATGGYSENSHPEGKETALLFNNGPSEPSALKHTFKDEKKKKEKRNPPRLSEGNTLL